MTGQTPPESAGPSVTTTDPEPATFVPDERTMDVTVLGAGVVGMATAYAAARRGLSVRLVDRATGPALGTSFANGAQLSYVYTDALGSPALWKHLPQLLLGLDPVFRMHWMFDPDSLKWGLAFLRNTTASRFRENTLAVLALAMESKSAMDALLQRHRIEFSHSAPGKMHLYHDAGALRRAEAIAAIKQRHGVVQQVLSPREAAAVEPALEGVAGLVGVMYSPQEEVGDPHRFCVELLRVLREHYGVQACFETDIDDLVREPDAITLATRDGRRLRSRQLVVCAGVESTRLAHRLGIRMPLMPMKGYSFTTRCGPHTPVTSITDTTRKLVFCRLGDQLRVAGLAELGVRDTAVDPRRSDLLVALARESLPAAANYDAIESRWAGLRPMTPSSMPIMRQVQDGIVFNVGHGMLGWTLAMGAGERAAALLAQR
jgi:D-amino-acid dehydrogenase